MILIIEAAHFFIDNPTKSTSFHASTMYMFAQNLLKELRAVHEEYCPENMFSFLAIMNSNLVRASGAGRVVKQLFFNNMHLFDCDPCKKM